MKHTLLIITALMLVVGCSSDPIDGSTLIEKGGLMYAPGSDKPYSGEAVWSWESLGRGEGTYKDGELDGLHTQWYENGQMREEETYKDGELDGLSTTWYENGQKKSERTYKDGKVDGLLTYWYENGQKESEWTYKDGILFFNKCWDEDGNEMDCPG
jgi:antitoxin component YwqK of YwqJK toxin-antitoxin module